MRRGDLMDRARHELDACTAHRIPNSTILELRNYTQPSHAAKTDQADTTKETNDAHEEKI